MSKNLTKFFRNYHRDIGYFVIGLTIMYSLTAIVLSARNTSLFKTTYKVEKTIEKNLKANDVESKYKTIFNKEDFKLFREELIKDSLDLTKIQLQDLDNEKIVFMLNRKKDFQNLEYIKSSGKVIYTIKAYPESLEFFIDKHKSHLEEKWSYLAIFYAFCLLFLAISGLFMAQGRNDFKQRGIYLVGAGVLLIVIFLFI